MLLVLSLILSFPHFLLTFNLKIVVIIELYLIWWNPTFKLLNVLCPGLSTSQPQLQTSFVTNAISPLNFVLLFILYEITVISQSDSQIKI